MMDLCPRCELRIAGTHLSEEYHKCEKKVKEWGLHTEKSCERSQNVKKGTGELDKNESGDLKRICDCCIGALQIDFEEIAFEVKRVFDKEGYVFRGTPENYSLSIALDPQIYVRQRAAELMFLPKNASTENVYITDIKKYLRYLTSIYITKVMNMENDQSSSFLIKLEIKHAESTDDMKIFEGIDASIVKSFVAGRVPTYLKNMNLEHFAKILPLKHASTIPTVEVSTSYAFIYVGGNYLKYKRNISNSKWLYGGNRVMLNSVEELLARKIVEYFKCDGYKFYSSGREDADVLMLGNGRPFYFALINPKITMVPHTSLKEIEDIINEENKGLVGVLNLSVLSNNDVELLKNSASTKNKRYRALIETSHEIPEYQLELVSLLKNIKIKQRTPYRVPKRADLVRDKMVIDINLHSDPEKSKELNLNLIDCELTTTAGTYVKEFVSGDMGRTSPSLCYILQCDYAVIKELDVLEICIDWPNKS